MPTVACLDNRSFSFDPAKVALVIVDMQHDFVSPGGACGKLGPVEQFQATIEPIRQVLDGLRRLGATIVHTRYGFKADLSDLPEAIRRHSKGCGIEYGTPGPMGRILTQGEKGHEIIPELTPLPGEIVIDKPSYGAFMRSDLEAQLKKRGITHLIVCGVTSNCCVESTLREAVDRGFYCLTLMDGIAASAIRLHLDTLNVIRAEGHLLGDLVKAKDLLAAL